MTTAAAAPATQVQIALTESSVAHNYAPLPVVLVEGEGAWVTDVEGRRYLDCLAGYSALNFGHRHPVLLDAARRQLDRLTLTSRAFYDDRLGAFARAVADLAGKEAMLPANTGVEAVEAAIKIARRWGERVKGVGVDRAVVVAAAGNFHGRTTTVIGFSTDAEARDGFGPFTPGFRLVDYGDAAALRAAVDADTVAVLLEPIQGEAGVVLPPVGYLREARRICDEEGVLLVADEIQSGLGRTGTTFASEHFGVVPDVYLLGKALGGGIVPVSAVVADWDVLGVLTPGSHGSTFAGNPLASAVGSAVVDLLASGEPQRSARDLGGLLALRLGELVGRGVTAVRSCGLWAGVDVDPALMTGRQLCERLLALGVLTKETHGITIRIAPPLTIDAGDVEWLVDRLGCALTA